MTGIMKSALRNHFLTLALLAVAAPAAAQAPGFSASDRRLGAEAHPQLLQQFGGAYEGPQADYVRRVGQRIAAESGMAARPQDYTVTLLNSNINNAFALPGGYVYISRQLLALMNDEAELAFVMGHEVGHVAARHSQKRQSRSTLTGIGAAILGVVTGSSIVSDLANTGAQLYTLSFSREQERQADSLGVRYLLSSGYDPMAAPVILHALEAQTSLEARLAGRGDAAPPGWLSTHPASAERVARIRAEAQKAVAAKPGARTTARDVFLNAIDGMPYDDDPAQGVITGTGFRHPGLGLAFEAPAGFALANSPTAVTGSRGQARFQFSGGRPENESLSSYSDKVWRAAGASQPPAVQISRVNGVETAISRLRTRQRGGDVDATLAVYRWANDSWYQLLTIAPAGQQMGLETMSSTVRRLSQSEIGAVAGRRLRVVSVRSGDTVQSLADRMAYDDDRLNRFLVLNGLEANSRLAPGARVKLVLRN